MQHCQTVSGCSLSAPRCPSSTARTARTCCSTSATRTWSPSSASRRPAPRLIRQGPPLAPARPPTRPLRDLPASRHVLLSRCPCSWVDCSARGAATKVTHCACCAMICRLCAVGSVLLLVVPQRLLSMSCPCPAGRRERGAFRRGLWAGRGQRRAQPGHGAHPRPGRQLPRHLPGSRPEQPRECAALFAFPCTCACQELIAGGRV